MTATRTARLGSTAVLRPSTVSAASTTDGRGTRSSSTTAIRSVSTTLPGEDRHLVLAAAGQALALPLAWVGPILMADEVQAEPLVPSSSAMADGCSTARPDPGNDCDVSDRSLGHWRISAPGVRGLGLDLGALLAGCAGAAPGAWIRLRFGADGEPLVLFLGVAKAVSVERLPEARWHPLPGGLLPAWPGLLSAVAVAVVLADQGAAGDQRRPLLRLDPRAFGRDEVLAASRALQDRTTGRVGGGRS